MTHPTYVLLYVNSPTESAAFYQRVLGLAPVEASPGFALFVLDSGLKLGLWAAHDVKPAATPVGGAELCLVAADNDAVDAWHARWREAGLPIAQAPVALDFGYTFVALDPDGHRLRVFAPGAA